MAKAIKSSVESKPVFPTQPDAQGFYYENETDRDARILTKDYDNGSKVKQTLINGKIAIVRKLRGKDNREIKKYMGEDTDLYLSAAVTVATTVDDKKQVMEYYEDLWMDDYNKLVSMYKDLNLNFM